MLHAYFKEPAKFILLPILLSCASIIMFSMQAGTTKYMYLLFALLTVTVYIFRHKIGIPVINYAVPALVLLLRLGRPGVRLGRVGWALVVPWLALNLLALGALLGAPPEARLDLVLGKTWLTCALNITLVSVPSFVATFWALRGMAPTRPAWAGACAGLLAAALGTVAYALHCPEMQAPFLAVWYVLGMVLPTAAGALLGPRLLRW